MLEKIKEAFEVYKGNMEQELNELLTGGAKKPCEDCAKNIELIQAHANFNESEPTRLTIEAEEGFAIHYEHLTRLSEHNGMPAITSHDFCETCYTTFYYEFCGFDSEKIFQFGHTELVEIDDYKHFLARNQNIFFQKFADFLTSYFKEQKGDVTLYLSLDEALKRKNHEYLVSYYTKEGKPLETLDHVHTYLSETEMFTASRIGWLFENEFLQQIIYPLEQVTFEYSSYRESITVEIDIKKIKERRFFDVYSKSFVPFEALDMEKIHMIKRNADTYALCGEEKRKLDLKPMTSFDEIKDLFEQFFTAFEHELLTAKFGTAYDAYLAEAGKFDSFFEGLKEFGRQNRQQVEKPTTLNGFEKFDNVRVQNGLYQGMRACIKEIDFSKETIGLVFFGETDFDNVIHVKPTICVKS